MTTPGRPHPHENIPVGKTETDQQRNASLLSDYDYDKYTTALTGFSGQDLQRIGFTRWEPAIRTRVGPRGNYKAGFAQLSDDRLILAVCRDNAHEDRAQRKFLISVYESRDIGLTWEEISQTPLFGKEPALAGLPDGTLVLMCQSLGAGAKPDEHPLSRSEDGGKTWETSVYRGFDYPRNFIVEADGSLMMITAIKPDFDGEGGGSSDLRIGRSTDGGRTWSYSEGVLDWDCTGFAEVSALRLDDGRLLAALRRQLPGTTGEGYEDTVLTESADDGKTWCQPWQLTITAQVHAYLTRLHDGRLLCTYSNYHVPFGVSAILSGDDGRSWDLDNTIRLSLSNDFWVGWPVTLALPGSDLITSYAVTSYREEAPRHVTAEVVRWRLP